MFNKLPDSLKGEVLIKQKSISIGDKIMFDGQVAWAHNTAAHKHKENKKNVSAPHHIPVR